MRVISAGKPGRCPACKRQFPVGERIAPFAAGSWGHEACVRAATGDRPAPPAGPAWTCRSGQDKYKGRCLDLNWRYEWPARGAVQAAVKGLPDRRYDPERKIWIVPGALILKLAAAVTESAPDLAEHLLEDPELGWARELAGERQERLQASRASDAPLEGAWVDVLKARGWELKPFQRAGVRGMLEILKSERPGVLLGDEMGLGKTPQALAYLSALPPGFALPALVVCPSALGPNWEREARRWLVHDVPVHVVRTGKPKSWSWEAAERGVVILPYDLLWQHVGGLHLQRDQETPQTWGTLIVDEVHKAKNPKTDRAKAIFGFYDKAAGAEIPGIPARFRLLLSGTAVKNRPSELWVLLKALDPAGLGRSWQYFIKRYCEGRQEQTYRGGPMIWKYDGASNLAELQEKMRAAFLIRRLKSEVLTELPPKVRSLLPLPRTAAVDEEGQAMDAVWVRLAALAALVELAKADPDPKAWERTVRELKAERSAVFTEMAAIRLRTALAKLDDCVSVIAGVLEEDEEEKVVVWAWHREVVEALAEKLGDYGVVFAHGGQTSQARDATVQQFQTDPSVRVGVMSIGAMGEGHTLTAAHRAFFVELPWTPGELSQAEDRQHRIGQRDTVFVSHLVLEGSIDEQIAQTLMRKQQVIASLLDVRSPGEEEAAADLLAGLLEAVERQRQVQRGEIAAHEQAMSAEVEAAKAAIKAAWGDDDDPALCSADHEVATARITRDYLVDRAAQLSPEQIAAIHTGLRQLASVCDRAHRQDAAGFNRLDAELGHLLAGMAAITPRQALLGQRMISRYRRQLSPELVATAMGRAVVVADVGKKRGRRKS